MTEQASDEYSRLTRENQALVAECERLAAENASLRERTVALWSDLDEALRRAEELHGDLLGLLSSSSWRVTKPLRAIMGLVRTLRRMSRP